MKLIPGLALYSIMGELKKDYMGTLEKVAEVGFKYIEYVSTPLGDDGNPVATPAQIGAKVKELGLTAISSHVMMKADSDIDALIADNMQMGAEAMVLPFAHMYTLEEVLKVADICNKAGKKCSEKGMKFYYHNHFQEFVKIDGKFALQLLLENTDPRYVNIELDTYWVTRAGLNPIEVIEKLGSRCKMIHQKDLSAAATPVNLYDALEGPINEETIMGILRGGAHKPTDIVEVGTGILDIDGICKKVSELNYAQYIIVELDHIYNMPPMDSIALSLKNLQKSIG
jgi:sugar phosphate isomerase/epimerase